MIDHYDWAGGREAMLRLGPDSGPVVIVALPLFEEANRTRTFAVTMMRALAERGVASVLPDLPGTNDSLVATRDATLADWRAAYAAVATSTGAVASVAIRSGAMIDGAADALARWHLSPQDGSGLLRELRRAGLVEREAWIEVAGNDLSRDLLDALAQATPSEGARTVRLSSDPAAADVKIEAVPLWRRAEPDNDPVLAESLAADIADWVQTCAG
ncbi:hypothetical protein [Sphingomonas sp.]|uniref:hypothetical protein n=1 Tax=Sphingomonas sp. TaxID=28214 RepID=UPI002DD61F17|nr:hypothetical protein [Sphingomonas sp.]